MFQVVVFALFFTSFFTKQEIIWGITAVFAGMLIYTSYNIEYPVYQYNATLLAYQVVNVTSYSFYLSGLNLMFFILAVVLGIYDILDKYGINMGSAFGKKE